ncbi:MAG TPA: hypothetical protein VEQ16_06470 [Acidocella sp.]|jgi:hypothetical protein|nr:hypothetical protein [Acidocella sp.]
MSMMILRETAQHVLRDRSARLLPVLVHQGQDGRTARAMARKMREEDEHARVGGRELLVIGLVAGLCVSARILLTWAAVTH